jgi:hypothetical protein
VADTNFRDCLLGLAERFENGELSPKSIWCALHGAAASLSNQTGIPYGKGIGLVFRAVSISAGVDPMTAEYNLGGVLRSKFSERSELACLLRTAAICTD